MMVLLCLAMWMVLCAPLFFPPSSLPSPRQDGTLLALSWLPRTGDTAGNTHHDIIVLYHIP